MSDTNKNNGMTKYAVVTDEENTKTAADNTKRICPVCSKNLDSGGACPEHGTEPFEPTGPSGEK